MVIIFTRRSGAWAHRIFHCKTPFLAHGGVLCPTYHNKDRIVAARSEDTVYTDAFAIDWPPHSPMRVIGNSVTEGFGARLLGHRFEDFARDAIAEEDGRPICRFSTDSRPRTTKDELEPLALFAGEVAGMIGTIPSASNRVAEIVQAAHVVLERLKASNRLGDECGARKGCPGACGSSMTFADIFLEGSNSDEQISRPSEGIEYVTRADPQIVHGKLLDDLLQAGGTRMAWRRIA